MPKDAWANLKRRERGQREYAQQRLETAIRDASERRFLENKKTRKKKQPAVTRRRAVNVEEVNKLFDLAAPRR